MHLPESCRVYTIQTFIVNIIGIYPRRQFSLLFGIITKMKQFHPLKAHTKCTRQIICRFCYFNSHKWRILSVISCRIIRYFFNDRDLTSIRCISCNNSSWI